MHKINEKTKQKTRKTNNPLVLFGSRSARKWAKLNYARRTGCRLSLVFRKTFLALSAFHLREVPWKSAKVGQ